MVYKNNAFSLSCSGWLDNKPFIRIYVHVYCCFFKLFRENIWFWKE